MKKTLGLLIVLGLVAAPALAQKVVIDYAHEYDFSQVKSFQYVEDPENKSNDPLMADRIVSLIKERLRDGGLEEVQENPDLFVTYHVTSRENQVLNTTHMGYGGYGGGWYGWGGGYGASIGSSSTTVSTYIEGTLIIDAYEPVEKKLVWRGSGTVTVKAKPEKRARQVEKILDKLGHRWQKILRNQGK
jgi:hypothetical protein